MDLGLKGKNALVTGSGKGIGKGIVLALAQEGANVVMHYNSNEALAKEAQKEVQDQTGSRIVLLQADLSKPGNAKKLVDESAAALGGLDILVNNAALQTNRDLTDYTQDAFKLIMDTNLMGYYRCMRAALPHLKKSGCGRIISISSVHGKRPTDFDPVYAMTKAGIKMLTREAAIEFAKYGITVNVLLPAAVQIEFKTESAFSGSGRFPGKPVERTRKYNRYPLGRVGLPSDMGYAVCFLASPQAEFLSGAAIRQDGAAMLL